jgi:hypothetical protein
MTTFRYADGRSEFRVVNTEHGVPSVGDVFRRDGQGWVVVQVDLAKGDEIIVTLEPELAPE